MLADRAEVGRLLVDWYESSRRDLPWRRMRSSYTTWVSEIMLQQTTVAAVVPRFTRFLEVFPDLGSLAQAAEEDVLAELQGLGYYRRFRAMKKAAEQVLREHAGELPRDRKQLEALPGIGSYTAGAILSIAHDQAEPAVDGNVVRVLTRLEALTGVHETPARKRALGGIVLEMMPAGRASDFNQALFDLGARICLPRAPRCQDCPLSRLCSARAEDRVAEFPELAPRRALVERQVYVLLIAEDETLLFERRPANESRMPGFLQLPEVWCAGDEDGPAELQAAFMARHGVAVEVGAEVARCRHSITHHKLDCRLHVGRLEVKLDEKLEAGLEGEADRVWLVSSAMDLWPVSTISKKLLEARR